MWMTFMIETNVVVFLFFFFIWVEVCFYTLIVYRYQRVKGSSCERNSQLNILTTVETEGGWRRKTDVSFHY